MTYPISPEAARKLSKRATAVSDPSDPSYGSHVTRAELAELLGTTHAPDLGLGDAGRLLEVTAAGLSPGGMALQTKIILRGAQPAASRAVALGGDGNPAHGATPASIADLYQFPAAYDGTGETIAVLNAGWVPLEGIKPALLEFWAHFGITPPEIISINLSPPPSPPGSAFSVAAFDLIANLSWVGAMAPGARIVLYNIDGFTISDPWSAMVAAAVEGKGDPTVLTSAWTTPEQVYYQACPRDRFSVLLEQAALLGISMVACAGDWGVSDGTPSIPYGDHHVAAAPWPAGVFPAGNPWVLAVGGTMLLGRHPLTEVGWSGPLPPDPAIRHLLAFFECGTSGGFSGQWPIPDWQRPTVNPPMGQRSFPRGPNQPAVVPYGRGYPDVALMAVGPTVQLPGAKDLSATGYRLVVPDVNGELEWVDYGGGTSIGAPIWGAILARMNQARRAAGQRRVGFVNPLLYRLAARVPASFRSIDAGNSDVVFRVIDSKGNIAAFNLAGYSAVAGWDPVTGLGVPSVTALIEASLSP